jgi:hypothetical protein
VGPTAASGSAPVTGSLDRDYLRERIKEILPLVRECYEQSLKAGPADGVLKVSFSIIGDPELGGIIEESKVLDDTPLARNEGLAECVQESMYAPQLKAPSGGGRLRVTHPFRFRASSASGSAHQ